MKFIAALLVFCSTAIHCQAVANTPVSRIVGLLANLQKKLEADLKDEEHLFQKYECWYRTVTSSKSASNQAANSRIADLEAYIADIDAGKIDFTTEEADLTKQVQDLKTALAEAKSLRDKEHEDYLAAEQEMTLALAALDEAVEVLKAGMGESLSQTRSAANLIAMRAGLKQAVKLAGSSLSVEDARYIEGFVNGEDPIMKDWKKLNREATWKMKYEARSGKILQVLEQLRTTFGASLEDAERQESEAAASYTSLRTSKEDILAKTEAALIALEKEHGARALSREEASDEMTALRAQVAADEGFITQVENSYQAKKQEWETREDLRHKEIAAIAQAISILHSDDARDQFKKSFASQGFSLLQKASRTLMVNGQDQLLKLSKLAADRNLTSLSQLVRQVKTMAGSGNELIDQVITKIDELLATIQAHEAEDLAAKEKCEADLAATKQQARMQSLAIDDYTEAIERANLAAADLAKQIEEQKEAIVEYNATIGDMNRTREDEHTAFLADEADDRRAVELIAQAITVLEQWKEASSSSSTTTLPSLLAAGPGKASRASSPVSAVEVKTVHRSVGELQVRRRESRQAPGEAPPPPPPTWEAPYEGATGETQGVLGILSLLQEDIEKDITIATNAENAAQAAYEAQKAELEAAILAAEATIGTLTGDRARKLQDAIDAGTSRDLKKGELDATMGEIWSMTPGCDFTLVHYADRVAKRHLEMDGLRDAKTILKGGVLPELLQRRSGKPGKGLRAQRLSPSM